MRRESVQGPLVLKPLFGSQGRGLKLIRTADELPPVDAVAGVYYLQRYVGTKGSDGFRDFRLLVSRGRVIAAMARHAAGWVTNVKQGGRPLPVVPDKDMNNLAVRATEAVAAAFAGVDILRDPDGHPTVLEVNSMPAWSGLQTVTRPNIARMLRQRSSRRAGGADGARSNGVTTLGERVAAAFSRACFDELEAPKPGNVHLFAPGSPHDRGGVRP